jgi:cbb3-type cytochrome c oxidase subunit III
MTVATSEKKSAMPCAAAESMKWSSTASVAASPSTCREDAAAARGAALYADKGLCYDCHSRDVQGDQAIGAPNLADGVWLYGDGSRESVFRSIAQGRAGVCPAFERRLSPAALRAVAVFVHDRAQHAGTS